VRINNKTALQFSQGDYTLHLPAHTWASIPDDDGEPSGRICLEARSRSDVHTLYNLVKGEVIIVNGISFTLDVYNAVWELETLSGGGGAATQGGAAPHP